MFVDVAEGRSTPLNALLDDWLLEKGYAARTEAAFRHGIKQLTEWCKDSDTPATIEAINRRAVGKFITDTFIRLRIDPATANKSITGLRAYWTWLAQRGHLPDEKNPWSGQSLKGKQRSHREPGEADKRPFTDDEVRTLLKGINKRPLSDFCLIAALTGMRRDEIACLKIKHIRGDVIKVPGTKNDNAVREVPIHPALSALIVRRTTGKKADEYVFHELPEQQSEARGRGAPITQAFTRTRRNLGVDDTPTGARQSRVDLHSWRRWFIRKAVTALEEGATGFTAWTIADVVGHSKEDGPLPMTMGRYPGRADMKALRACVEAVQLPIDHQQKSP
jgi:integrase